MKTFDEFVNEKHIVTNINNKFLKFAFMVSYNKAIKHFNKLHEKITEDHVLEFINQYMFNNYGVDMTHTADVYRYIKTHLHNKFVKKEKTNEGVFSKIKKFFRKPVYVDVSNRNEYDILMRYLENNDYHWDDNSKPTEKDVYSRLKAKDRLDFLIFIKNKIIYESNMYEYFGGLGEHNIISYHNFMKGKYDTDEYKKKKSNIRELTKDIDPMGEENWED